MNPLLGTLFHAIGGLAASSFYIPYSKVKHWPWELYWLVGGFFAWLIAPAILIILTIPAPMAILSGLSLAQLALPYIFGLMWGIGGLTFGLTMRYLGVGLGMALSLGLTAVFGTLIPPLMKGQMQQLISSSDGQITMLGILTGIIGIAIVGWAGVYKDKELGEKNKTGVQEFNLNRVGR